MEKTSLPTLSVIIPCYNAEKFLPRAFECLDNQTYKNLQIIFVDDGSQDQTLPLISEYCSKNSKAQFVTGENQGVGQARNKGLECIDGEYFTFYDADDLIYPIHFENLMNKIIENNAEMAVCGIKRIKSGKDILESKIPKNTEKFYEFIGQDAFKQYLSQEKLDFVLWNKVFKTKTLKESGAKFLDTRYGEEIHFLYSYFKCVKKVVFCPAKTYVYVQHGSSLMHLKFNESRLDILKNLQIVKDDAEKYSKEISNYVSSMRSGYIVGLLYFIKKSEYKNPKVILEILETLKRDVKLLKYCKKTAVYKRLFIPLIPPIAKVLLRKRLK